MTIPPDSVKTDTARHATSDMETSLNRADTVSPCTYHNIAIQHVTGESERRQVMTGVVDQAALQL
jgi:hypothetical protein